MYELHSSRITLPVLVYHFAMVVLSITERTEIRLAATGGFIHRDRHMLYTYCTTQCHLWINDQTICSL